MDRKYRKFVVTAIVFIVSMAAGLTLNATQSAGASGVCSQKATLTMPQPVSLTTAAPGVTIADAGVLPYSVGGATVDGVRAALNDCAPRVNGSTSEEFLAYTNYAVDWSYGIESLGDGTCRLDEVKVGLALSQTLPTLTTDSSNVRAKWNTFMSGLTTHENGHKAIDVTRARALYDSLSTLHTSCATIAAKAVELTTAGVQALTVANAAHDVQTDHGRTQNAIW